MRADRSRQLETYDAIDAAEAVPPIGSSAFLAVTISQGNYPNTNTNTQVVLALNPVTVDCDETEAATPTFAADTDTVIYAMRLGTNVPNTGTYVIVHGVGGRLAFQYYG